MDRAEARAMHKGDARAHRAKQEKPRSLHDDENNESTVFEVPLGQIEDCLGKTLFSQVEEVDRKEGDGKEDHGEEVDSEEANREEAHDHLFAFEESRLELKDEQSS
jgi:hypothetical protein